MIKTIKIKLQNKLNSDTHLAELFKGAGVAFTLKILGIICGYIFTMLVTRTLGAEAWGIFALSFTVLQIASVISRLGMDTALLRFVAEYSSQGKWELVWEAYLKALKLVIPVSLVLSITLFFMSPYIAKYIFHKDYLSPSFSMISVAIVPSVLLFINSESLRGLKKIKEYTFFQNVGIFLIASIILKLCLIFYKKNVYSPILSYIISVFIIFLLSLSFWLKILKFHIQHLQFQINKKITDHISKNSTISYRYLLSVSIPMFFSSSLFFIMGWTDIIMLGIFSTEKQIGIYNVAVKISSIISINLIAINSIIAPKFAECYGHKNFNNLQRIAKQGTKLLFFSSLVSLIIICIFSRHILALFGKTFKNAIDVLLIVSLTRFVNNISGPIGQLLNMTNNQIILRNIIFLSLLTNIFLNYYLIPIYGILGAALATMFSSLLINILGLFYIKKIFNFWLLYVPFN